MFEVKGNIYKLGRTICEISLKIAKFVGEKSFKISLDWVGVYIDRLIWYICKEIVEKLKQFEFDLEMSL